MEKKPHALVPLQPRGALSLSFFQFLRRMDFNHCYPARSLRDTEIGCRIPCYREKDGWFWLARLDSREPAPRPEPLDQGGQGIAVGLSERDRRRGSCRA